MNNTNKIIIGVVVVAIALGLFFFFKKADAPSSVVSDTPAEEEKSVARSLRELIAGGQSQKCTFTNTVENSTSEGTVYLSGNKMRGDFTSRVTTPVVKTVASHMITDGTEMRVWTDGEAMGFLMDISAQTDVKTGDTPTTETSYESPVDLDDTDTSYNCEPWRADASLFVPPASVKFQSMADMMKGMNIPLGADTTGSDAGMGPGMEAGGSMDLKAMQCAACDSAPDEKSKAECKAYLQCT